jgi:hypothetical protein
MTDQKTPIPTESRCLVCGATPTIRAHLIPQAFSREVRGGDIKFALTSARATRFRPTQNGIFDPGILCQQCDNALGKNEKYTFEVLAGARRLTKARVGTHVVMEPVSGDRLIRFAAGLCWKYCVTQRPYGRIDAGPFADRLRDVAFVLSLIPPDIDLFMVHLSGGGYEKHFYRAPLPDRYKSTNFIRFSVGGFVMFLKIDKRPNPNFSSSDIWMRGRHDVVFYTAPFDAFEEGQAVLVNSRNSYLRKFLDSAAPKRRVLKA